MSLPHRQACITTIMNLMLHMRKSDKFTSCDKIIGIEIPLAPAAMCLESPDIFAVLPPSCEHTDPAVMA